MRTKKCQLFILLTTCLLIAAGCQKSEAQSSIPDNSLIGKNDVEFGKYTWTVLDETEDSVLIVSNEVVDKHAYNIKYQAVDWENSDIRAYLNGDFLESNFSPAEQEQIVETTVTNGNNPWFDTAGGNETQDKLFLLSLEEVTRYYGDSGKLQHKTKSANGDYNIDDQFNEQRITTYDGANVWWWLRSPGHTTKFATAVTHSGRLEVGGYFVKEKFGVRPALWLKVDESFKESL